MAYFYMLLHTLYASNCSVVVFTYMIWKTIPNKNSLTGQNCPGVICPGNICLVLIPKFLFVVHHLDPKKF